MERRERQRLDDLKRELAAKEDELRHVEHEREERLSFPDQLSLLVLIEIQSLGKRADKLGSQIVNIRARMRESEVRITWMRGARWRLQGEITSGQDGPSRSG